jgi:hypothetical protein
MATRKRSNGSKKDESSKRDTRISRRALIGGLGGGLALTTLGKGQSKSTGDFDANAFVGPETRSVTAARTFNPQKLEKIVVDSKGMKVTYIGQEYSIAVPEKLTVTIDMNNKTVDYACLLGTPSPATPTPTPGSPKKS